VLELPFPALAAQGRKARQRKELGEMALVARKVKVLGLVLLLVLGGAVFAKGGKNSQPQDGKVEIQRVVFHD
jgi:hypothetical protein